MFLEAAFVAAMGTTANLHFVDNLLYTLEDNNTEKVVFIACDEESEICYARMETFEIWLRCNPLTLKCSVIETTKIKEPI